MFLEQSNNKHRADALFGMVDKCVNKDFENYSNAMSASDVITFALQCDYVDVRRKTESERWDAELQITLSDATA